MSPFGPLIAESSAYLAGRRRGDPYRGYHFRILPRQGTSAPGGAYSYLINGRMLGGFAMVAFPDQYGESGVMSFIVSHNGKVYEKDLGRNTAAAVAKLSAFDPGAGWQVVVPCAGHLLIVPVQAAIPGGSGRRSMAFDPARLAVDVHSTERPVWVAWQTGCRSGRCRPHVCGAGVRYSRAIRANL